MALLSGTLSSVADFWHPTQSGCGVISGTRFTLSLGPWRPPHYAGWSDFLTPPFSVIKPLLSVVWHNQPDFLEPISFRGIGYTA
jgi:hypothetical protein